MMLWWWWWFRATGGYPYPLFPFGLLIRLDGFSWRRFVEVTYSNQPAICPKNRPTKWNRGHQEQTAVIAYVRDFSRQFVGLFTYVTFSRRSNKPCSINKRLRLFKVYFSVFPGHFVNIQVEFLSSWRPDSDMHLLAGNHSFSRISAVSPSELILLALSQTSESERWSWSASHSYHIPVSH